jgi:hypothetical protein
MINAKSQCNIFLIKCHNFRGSVNITELSLSRSYFSQVFYCIKYTCDMETEQGLAFVTQPTLILLQISKQLYKNIALRNM